jgi:hypothetical protein
MGDGCEDMNGARPQGPGLPNQPEGFIGNFDAGSVCRCPLRKGEF